jgi:hypothetical protein
LTVKTKEQIAKEVDEIKYQLAGSLIEYTQIFYKLRTHRLFLLSDPPGRESHYLTMSRALTSVLDGKIQRLIINVPPRFGKAIDVNTPVLTSHGWKRAGDVCVGDELIGSNNWTKVTGVYPQGILPAKRVVFNDRSNVICNDEHLWAVRDRYTPTLKVKTTAEIRQTLHEADGRKHWQIPMIKGIISMD